MGPVVLGGVRHLDTAGGKFDFSCSATVAECSMASRSRWTVLKWWDSPPGTQPSPCLLQSSTQPSIAQACAQRPYQQATAGGCRSLSTERLSQPLALLKPLSFFWTQSHPCPVPLRSPTCFSSSSFLEPAQVAGGGELIPPTAAPLRLAFCCAAILTPKTLISNGARYKDGKI